MRLFHIIAKADWATAVRLGELRPASLTREGFVHLSYADQVAATANRFYRDQADLTVIEFDADLIGSPVLAEDSHGTGQLFPHVYSALPVSAAIAEHPLPRTAAGDYSFRAT